MTTRVPTAPEQTLVWNWYWNCNGLPTTPDPPPTPDPAAGAVTIVWNWHWNCPDDAPPEASATGTTVCVGCNTSISVRVSSPGDSAGVTQTTGTDMTSLAAGVAAAAQAAAQVLPEAVPQQPAAPPPAPPLPATPTPPEPPTIVAPTPAVAPTLVAPTVVVPAVVVPAGDDPPRHGAPDFAAAPAQSANADRSTTARVIHVRAIFETTTAHTTSIVRVKTVRVDTVRTVRQPPGAGTRTPRPFSPSPPHAPTPLAIAPASSETHDTGGFTSFALGAGALGVFLLVFLGYAVPGLQTVRSQPGRAQPDPPG